MKYILILVFCFVNLGTLLAQQQTAKQLQESAKILLQQSDFEKAVLVLDRARQQEPGNIEILRDLAFASYLKRDYAKATEIGKVLTERPNADSKDFQVLGLSYKAMASYKECAKLYKAGLKKFPNSGVIYNEYAELMAIENALDEAIEQWEKGIEMDPGYSSNYYNSAMYYVRSKNWVPAVLYSELFLNLESYTARTTDIKKELTGVYRNLFAPSVIGQLLNAKATTPFEKAILEVLAKTENLAKVGLSVENIMRVRTRFIEQWVQEKQKQYPFRLFDHQQYLLNEGLFEAYNYWLFSEAVNADSYKTWQNNHPKETAEFKKFQENRVFKIPAGQYYFSR